MSVKETINSVFAKLPFKALAEKIPAETQAKAPILQKAIPFANQIVCGLAVVIVVVTVACSGGGSGGGGRPNPATDFSYDLTEDGTGILIKGYTGGPGKVVIPAKIEDMPVLEIGDKAFDGQSMTFSLDFNSGSSSVGSKTNEKAGITAIVIPDTVRKIGRSAFANTAITSIVIPDSVTELVYDWMGHSFIFSGCKQLAEIRFSDNIEILPANLFGFGGSTALQKANLPKNVKIIAGGSTGGTFNYCGELTELIIPETLTSVEFAEAKQDYETEEIRWFKEGEKINSYDTQGPNNAFEGCTKLPLKIRQQLKTMGYNGKI